MHDLVLREVIKNNKHEPKVCPRCNKEFVCKVNRVHNCDCMTIHLNKKKTEFIGETYNDCLCISCLIEIKKHIN
jgi:hypothetical protein